MKPSKWVMLFGLWGYVIYVTISAIVVSDFSVLVLCIFNGILFPLVCAALSTYITYHQLDHHIAKRIREARKRRKK